MNKLAKQRTTAPLSLSLSVLVMLRFAAHHLPDVADADVKPASERDADSLANVLAFVFPHFTLAS